MSHSLRIGAVGFSLIAVCYGFARFAFGLFLPQIDADLDLGSGLSGLISGGSFAAYCIAIVAAALLTEQIGARAVAVGAATIATLGMAGIALAPSAGWLAFFVIVAGASTGLASPPMAAAVATTVARDRQDVTNTVINAGTSAGVVLSGPVALAFAGYWRQAFLLFAVIAAMLIVATVWVIPRDKRGERSSILPSVDGVIVNLVAAAFLMGAASTAIWSFGAQLVSQELGWGTIGTGILWMMIGGGGIAGAWAGMLVARFGLGPVHWTFLILMALAVMAIGSHWTTPMVALAGGVVFGASYVMLTGVYLVWGVRALPDRPASGLMLGFLTIAVGQTAGAPIFGYLLESMGSSLTVSTFSLLALLAGVFQPAHAAAAVEGSD